MFGDILVETSSSKENVANLVLVSMWTSVKVEEKRHKQFEATTQKHFGCVPFGESKNGF